MILLRRGCQGQRATDSTSHAGSTDRRTRLPLEIPADCQLVPGNQGLTPQRGLASDLKVQRIHVLRSHAVQIADGCLGGGVNVSGGLIACPVTPVAAAGHVQHGTRGHIQAAMQSSSHALDPHVTQGVVSSIYRIGQHGHGTGITSISSWSMVARLWLVQDLSSSSVLLLLWVTIGSSYRLRRGLVGGRMGVA